MKCIILAGGSGSRLWPLSTEEVPKQFLRIDDEETLLQKTILRFYPQIPVQDIFVVTKNAYSRIVENQLVSIDPEFENQIIVEPEQKNTAPAIALAVKYLQEEVGVDDSTTFLICSSDHFIEPADVFLSSVLRAESLTDQGDHVLFGIRPHKIETGYGYIQVSRILKKGACRVERFVEKPTAEKAQQFLSSDAYLWNAGIFLFRIDAFVKEMKLFCPEIGLFMSLPLDEFRDRFTEMPSISIDYALMERSRRLLVVPLEVFWSDIGSWDSLYDHLDKDERRNVKIGNVIDIDTHNCLVMGGKRLVSTIGLSNLIIVDTEDAVFIGKRGESQKVQQLVKEVKKRKKDSLEEQRRGSYEMV